MSTDRTSIEDMPRRDVRPDPRERGVSRRNLLLSGTTLAAATAFASAAPVRTAQAQAGDKPNILVIFGDDIGLANISAYSHGLMGYRTPNIDRIASEGMMFIDYYAEQSCTAGRSSFITGQATLRTGLSKVGIPAAPVGLQDRDPTIAQLLKPLGYATGQFGKNHLGDRNQYLPTVHGFDEFFGNLYHLNAEEEPENFNYPRDARFREQFGPRGVLRCKATDVDDPTEQPRWGRVGRQTIEDTGPLTRKRMETIDDETSDAAVDFMERQVAAGTPFFCWFNSTRMHARTHVRAEHRDQPGLTARTEYADGMIEHDGHIGKLLQTLDDLGIANDTIVIYTTDNGPHMNTWPDGAMTPFRSEKNTNWEGAFRVPCMIRWPGRIEPGQVSLEIVSGLDWCPTLLAAAGDPDIKEKLLTGYEAAGKIFKVHLDGYNQLPYLTGQEPRSGRGNSSTSTTTAISSACATKTGRSCSWSSARPARYRSGPSRSRRCASPSSSISAPTPTSGPTSPPTPIGTGCSITRTSAMARRQRRGSSRRSRNSRRASGRRRSPSTRRWRSCRRASAPTDAPKRGAGRGSRPARETLNAEQRAAIRQDDGSSPPSRIVTTGPDHRWREAAARRGEHAIHLDRQAGVVVCLGAYVRMGQASDPSPRRVRSRRRWCRLDGEAGLAQAVRHVLDLRVRNVPGPRHVKEAFADIRLAPQRRFDHRLRLLAPTQLTENHRSEQ